MVSWWKRHLNPVPVIASRIKSMTEGAWSVGLFWGLFEGCLGLFGKGFLGAAGAGAILSAGLLKLASFETVKAFVDAAMQGDPSKTVMSGGGSYLRMTVGQTLSLFQLARKGTCYVTNEGQQKFMENKIYRN